jgi:UDP-3-O-[3-hydroxymyristoyl] glucosamine N-acyltransferase
MKIVLSRIAALVGGTVRGDPDRVIEGVAAFESASPEDITFAVLPKFLKRIGDTAAGAVIVPRDAKSDDKDLLIAANPQAAFAKTVALFHPSASPVPGVSPLAFLGQHSRLGEGSAVSAFVYIGRDVRVGRRCVLHPHVFIGDEAVIGDDVVIYPNVTIRDKCRIGNRVVIHAGTVIGSDGYGYAQEDGRHHKIPQIGIVQIDDDVEIGACNTIDRATLGKTWIQRGVKTDNLVHIAHNVTVGEDSLLVAQVGIAGSTTLGKGVILAGKAGTGPHVTIGDGAILAPKASVVKSVKSGEVLIGSPGIPRRQWMRIHRVYARLPELRDKVTALEKRLDRLAGREENQKVERGDEE